MDPLAVLPGEQGELSVVVAAEEGLGMASPRRATERGLREDTNSMRTEDGGTFLR